MTNAMELAMLFTVDLLGNRKEVTKKFKCWNKADSWEHASIMEGEMKASKIQTYLYIQLNTFYQARIAQLVEHCTYEDN